MIKSEVINKLEGKKCKASDGKHAFLQNVLLQNIITLINSLIAQ